MVDVGSLEAVVGGREEGGRSKVYQLDLFRLGVVEEVLILDVPVIDLQGAAVEDSVQCLRDDGSSGALRHGGLPVVDIGEEILVAGTVLHHDDPVSVLEEVLAVSDDVSVSQVPPQGDLVRDVHLGGGAVGPSLHSIV